MELDNQVNRMDEELKLLKNEIKQVLLEVQEHVLSAQNPFTSAVGSSGGGQIQDMQEKLLAEQAAALKAATETLAREPQQQTVAPQPSASAADGRSPASAPAADGRSPTSAPAADGRSPTSTPATGDCSARPPTRPGLEPDGVLRRCHRPRATVHRSQRAAGDPWRDPSGPQSAHTTEGGWRQAE